MHLVPRPCHNCGVEFTPLPQTRGPRFCSKGCRDAFALAAANAAYRARVQTFDLVCVGCGETFSVSAVTPRKGLGSGGRRFCSKACSRRYYFFRKYGAAYARAWLLQHLPPSPRPSQRPPRSRKDAT